MVSAICSVGGNKNSAWEKSRECHNHKQQPFLDTKRKRKQTKQFKLAQLNVEMAVP